MFHAAPPHVPALPEQHLHPRKLIRRKRRERGDVLRRRDERLARKILRLARERVGLAVVLLAHVEVELVRRAGTLGATTVDVQLLEENPLWHTRAPKTVRSGGKRRQRHAAVEDSLPRLHGGDAHVGIGGREHGRLLDGVAARFHRHFGHTACGDCARRTQRTHLFKGAGNGLDLAVRTHRHVSSKKIRTTQSERRKRNESARREKRIFFHADDFTIIPYPRANPSARAFQRARRRI